MSFDVRLDSHLDKHTIRKRAADHPLRIHLHYDNSIALLPYAHTNIIKVRTHLHYDNSIALLPYAHTNIIKVRTHLHYDNSIALLPYSHTNIIR